jgi:hypothetical protein
MEKIDAAAQGEGKCEKQNHFERPFSSQELREESELRIFVRTKIFLVKVVTGAFAHL